MSEFQLKRKLREENKKQAIIDAEQQLESKRLAYKNKTQDVLEKVHKPSEKYKQVGDRPKAKSTLEIERIRHSDILISIYTVPLSCVMENTLSIPAIGSFTATCL